MLAKSYIWVSGSCPAFITNALPVEFPWAISSIACATCSGFSKFGLSDSRRSNPTRGVGTPPGHIAFIEIIWDWSAGAVPRTQPIAACFVAV